MKYHFLIILSHGISYFISFICTHTQGLSSASDVASTIYSLYKKKRKPYIMFDNSSHFEDEHFKLVGFLDWYGSYQ